MLNTYVLREDMCPGEEDGEISAFISFLALGLSIFFSAEIFLAFSSSAALSYFKMTDIMAVSI